MPLECILLLAWCVIFWMGTKPEVFFSKFNFRLIIAISFFNILAHIYSVLVMYNQEADWTNEGFIILFINLLNQTYVILIYFAVGCRYRYSGKVIKDFDTFGIRNGKSEIKEHLETLLKGISSKIVNNKQEEIIKQIEEEFEE